jgi:rfaE bifunctional protein nucleotidyltransferase chain/domain
MTLPMKSKIVSRKRLAVILAKLRARGKKIVFTNGCFDIIHAGHARYLARARSLGDILVIGLNSDKSVKRLKGASRPINTEKDRAIVLAALASVDYVTSFREDTPDRLIRELKPDILAKGGDWKTADIVGSAFVKSRGGKVVRIPFLKGRSTTATLKKLCRTP